MNTHINHIIQLKNIRIYTYPAYGIMQDMCIHCLSEDTKHLNKCRIETPLSILLTVGAIYEQLY